RTSDWRGENAIRSMPNRAISNRLAAVAMNSIAQQAVPKGMGQSELARDQLVRASSRVVIQLDETPAISTPSGAGPSGRLAIPTGGLPASIYRCTPPPG